MRPYNGFKIIYVYGMDDVSIAPCFLISDNCLLNLLLLYAETAVADL